MIKDRLLDLDYYYYKLPLYVRNMSNLKEHFKIWYDILISINDSCDEIFCYLDIFNNNYFVKCNVDPESNSFDFLDKLGNLYGVNRIFTCNYNLEGQKVTVEVNLNNKDYLQLIKARIIRNNFKGTYEELYFLNKNILNLNIIYVTSNIPGYCDIYADISSFNNTNIINPTSIKQEDDVKKHLFYSGLYNCESIGIVYSYHITDLYSIGTWDDNHIDRRWGPQEDISNDYKAARWG